MLICAKEGSGASRRTPNAQFPQAHHNDAHDSHPSLKAAGPMMPRLADGSRSNQKIFYPIREHVQIVRDSAVS